MITFEKWNHPSDAVIMHFANAFDISFYKAEEDLKDTFSELHENELIKNRVEKLDKYYHTGLKRAGKFNAVVDKIRKQGDALESKILHGDLDAVKSIADKDGYNCFSFATKYCSFVNKEAYPLYDNRVRRALNWFQANIDTRFYHERFLKLDHIRENCEYKAFVGIINEFIKKFELSCSYKDLDKFLWLVGGNLPDKDGDLND